MISFDFFDHSNGIDDRWRYRVIDRSDIFNYSLKLHLNIVNVNYKRERKIRIFAIIIVKFGECKLKNENVRLNFFNFDLIVQIIFSLETLGLTLLPQMPLKHPSCQDPWLCASKKENEGNFTWKKEDGVKEKEAQKGEGCVKISGLKS